MRFALALLCVFAVGCSDKTPTSPEGPTLVFAAKTPVTGAPDSATAVAGTGQIGVSATFAGPDPCRVLDGDLESTESRQLTLRVSVRPVSGVCTLVVGRFAYDAMIDGLTPGNYTLQVVHTYPSTNWPTATVISQTLTVK